MCRYIRCAFASAIALLLLAPIVRAQASVAQFDLPSQPLADSLRAVGSQTNTNVLFDTPLVAGRKAPALKAQLTPDQAITRLLAGTGIAHEFLNDTTVVLSPAVAGTTSANKGAPADTSRNSQSSPATTNDGTSKEGKKDSSAGFRLAQVGQGKSAGDFSVEKSAPGLTEIIVTAQKRPELQQDVPVPVTAINADTLVAQNLLRVQDYYSSVPGLNFSEDSNGDAYLSIRGITTGALNGNPTVGITVDDVPFGSSAAAGGTVPDIDPGDLARIEVLRGPQGTLYGASSIGGLIKFVTLDPSTEALTGRVQAGTSTVYNGAELGYNFRGSVNVPLGDKFAIRASGFTREDPGYVDNTLTGERGVNEARTSGGHVAAMWRPSDSFTVKLSALYQEAKSNGTSDVDVGLGDLQQNSQRGTGGFDKRLQLYSATVAAKLGTIDLTAVTGYGATSESQSLDFTSAYGPYYTFPAFGVNDTAVVNKGSTDKFTQELRFSSPTGPRFEWLAGLFYSHETSQGDQLVLAEDPANGSQVGVGLNSVGPSTYEEYAGFADLTVHITDQFDVQLGGRESQNRQTNSGVSTGPFTFAVPPIIVTPEQRTKDNSFTYLVTPQFKVSPDLMVYARLASGYRPGGPNGGAILGHYQQSFAPDTTKNYELGVKGDVIDHALTFDVSLYYIDWKNIQLAFIQPGTYDYYITNGSRAKSDGVELSVESKPLTGLTISSWVVLAEAKLTEALPLGAVGASAYGVPGDRLPYSSRFSGNLSLQQDFPIAREWNGFVVAAGSYVGNRLSYFQSDSAPGVALPRQEFPGYAKIDLRAGVKRDSWTINVFATNVTNKRGMLAGGIGTVNPLAFNYIQPRTIGLFIVKTF